MHVQTEEQRMSKVEQYLKTYNGRELLAAHSLEECGHWNVFGEQVQSRVLTYYTRLLGTYEGRLGDVLIIAANHPLF